MKKKTIHKKKGLSFLRLLCWIVIPLVLIILLILEGLGFYSFTAERLIVLGAGLVVALLPFFSEITVKNLSIKRDKNSK